MHVFNLGLHMYTIIPIKKVYLYAHYRLGNLQLLILSFTGTLFSKICFHKVVNHNIPRSNPRKQFLAWVQSA